VGTDPLLPGIWQTTAYQMGKPWAGMQKLEYKRAANLSLTD